MREGHNSKTAQEPCNLSKLGGKTRMWAESTHIYVLEPSERIWVTNKWTVQDHMTAPLWNEARGSWFTLLVVWCTELPHFPSSGICCCFFPQLAHVVEIFSVGLTVPILKLQVLCLWWLLLLFILCCSSIKLQFIGEYSING